MCKLIFSNKAINDLSAIWEYTTQNWSEQQADKYYDFLIDSCNQILLLPDIGRNYDIAMKGLKGYQSGKHIIFYFHKENSIIEITRILHERMDLKNRLKDK